MSKPLPSPAKLFMSGFTASISICSSMLVRARVRAMVKPWVRECYVSCIKLCSGMRIVSESFFLVIIIDYTPCTVKYHESVAVLALEWELDTHRVIVSLTVPCFGHKTLIIL